METLSFTHLVTQGTTGVGSFTDRPTGLNLNNVRAYFLDAESAIHAALEIQALVPLALFIIWDGALAAAAYDRNGSCFAQYPCAPQSCRPTADM